MAYINTVYCVVCTCLPGVQGQCYYICMDKVRLPLPCIASYGATLLILQGWASQKRVVGKMGGPSSLNQRIRKLKIISNVQAGRKAGRQQLPCSHSQGLQELQRHWYPPLPNHSFCGRHSTLLYCTTLHSTAHLTVVYNSRLQGTA